MITTVTQRWNRDGKPRYRPAGEVINTRNYEIAEIEDDATAKAYVCARHYARSYPAARRRFGLYRRGGQLVGVAVFSHPASNKVLTNVFKGTDARDSVELGRFVLDDSVEANGESWMLGYCFRTLRKDFLGIVSFSDDTPRTDADGNQCFRGHVGTIYASTNGVYTGRGTARTLNLLPDGRVYSHRAIQKVRAGERGWRAASEELVAFGAPPAPEAEEARRAWLDKWLRKLTRHLKHPGNHRYAWALDRHFKLPPSLPYPKFTAKQLQPALFVC